MVKKSPVPELPNDNEWVVSWEAVETAQLRAWLQATPAQRLAMTEELLELSRKARASNVVSLK